MYCNERSYHSECSRDMKQCLASLYPSSTEYAHDTREVIIFFWWLVEKREYEGSRLVHGYCCQ